MTNDYSITAEKKGEPMSDLIERQAAIAEFSCCELTPDGGIDANYAIDFLKHMPPAQPEKTGYWFFSTTDFKTHCSACKQSEWHGYIPTPEEALKWMPICPKCGARMKESEIRTKKSKACSIG